MSEEISWTTVDHKASEDIRSGPHGWIQWKGTEVCIDIHCECGHFGHVDTSFFYFYECPECKKRYIVSQHVRLLPVTGEIEKEILSDGIGFQTSTA